ncbi:MAG: pilus assembly PilX N-terminal domain-containing protein [Candidatus Gracilibacteria bacterium]|jgi:hypothetical protein
MNEKILTIGKDKKGSALLIAMLVMGVFITISIALFALIIREIRSTKDFIDAGKAYYAAESGIEESLYYLNTKLPGWEGAEDENKGEFDSGVNFAYEVDNRCSSYPCFKPTEYDIDSLLQFHPEKVYQELALSQNVTVPMFVVITDETGKETVKSIKNFVVQFFAGFNPNTDLNISGGQIAGWDVLRWKLFGMKKDTTGNYVTDSIDDFTAVSSMLNTDNQASAKKPSWFGSYNCSYVSMGPQVSYQNLDKKFSMIGPDAIVCVPYEDVWNTGDGACTNTQARDYYNYVDGKVESVSGCYEIGQFMEDHMPSENAVSAAGSSPTGLNYLSLTNLMNPAMFKPDLGNYLEKRDMSKIFFRVEAFDDPDDENDTYQFVRDTAEIVSRGFSGHAKQGLEVHLKRGGYMPVFNFAIYSTKGSTNNFYK